jgi:hypothetical protein
MIDGVCQRSADRSVRRLHVRSAVDQSFGHVDVVAAGLDRLDAILGYDPLPEQVSQAFWHACNAGQRRAAEYLLSRGADLNWEPDYATGTPLDAASGRSTMQENVISWLRELGARTASTD